MDLTPIFNAIIALAAAVVTAVIVPYIKSKTTAEQQKQLAELVSMAVAAAEQMFAGSKKGQEKKEFALEFLAEHGVKTEKAEALIEAAVFQLKNAATA